MKLLRGFWKILVGIKDALVLLLLLIFFGLLFAGLSAAPNPRPPGSGALVVDLDGALVEQPAQADPVSAIAGQSAPTREYRLRDVVRGLRAAAKDSDVKAVVLDLDRFTGGGQTAVADAGDAIDEVRRAGKPVLAFATGYSDSSYMLAAHASEVWLDPQGAVLVAGPGAPHLYYKGLLDKLGVEAKVYRVGKFKSAVEPYIRSDQSPEAKAMNQALVDSLWAGWQDDVRKARPKAQLAAYVADPAKALTAAGGDTAAAALGAGLVDKLGDRIAFGKRVAAIAGQDAKNIAGNYKAIPLDGWIAAHPEKTGGDAIGVVTIAGTIVDGEAAPGTAGGTTISRLLLDALARKNLKALVVRVDSPGGSVTASERIRSAIMEAKGRGLPVVVSMGSVAASGGYWVSTPADRIFAEPSTITGSIGVFGILPTFKGTLAKLGLSADGVKSTPLSGEPDVYHGTSPQFDTLMQTGIEGIYKRFTGLVAASRHLTVARVDEIGQGHVWAGGTARQIGLVDQFGGLDDAIAEAARRAKLDPANVHPVFIERQPSKFAQFVAGLTRKRDAGSDPDDAWTRVARAPERDLLRAFGDLDLLVRGPAIQVQCLECPVSGPPRPIDAGLAKLLLARLGLG
jgi:protease IV